MAGSGRRRARTLRSRPSTAASRVQRRWYVRMRGEEKDITTVWLTLGQRTLRYETYVMPAPEENQAELYEHLLRRNDKLVGAHFSIGLEDAVFLRGELPLGAPDRGRARPGDRHALRHRRALLPHRLAHRLRQPVWRRLTSDPASPAHTSDADPAGCGPCRGSAVRATPDPTVPVACAAVTATKLVIFGGGNMGAALVGGLLRTGWSAPEDLAVVEPVAARRSELADILPGVGVGAEAPAAADGVVIAVKPADVATACRTASALGARAGAVDRRWRVDLARWRPPSAHRRRWCGRCRTRRPSSARRRRRSLPAPTLPMPTSLGPRPSSPPSASWCGSPSTCSTPSPGSLARARPTCSSSLRRSPMPAWRPASRARRPSSS